MAAGMLAEPGTQYGPCKSCLHTDCAATRNQARHICKLCDKMIGYETRFYHDDELGIVHAVCLETKIEAEQ